MDDAWSWERDEVNLLAACLDGASLASFACTSRAVADNLRSRETIRFLAELRGLGDTLGISSVEHLEVAEVMAQCKASIFFGWGSTTVHSGANSSLQRLAKLLHRHPSLELSIEAHCGLEARYAMPLPGQAREFTHSRAEAVVDALQQQAGVASVPLEMADDGRPARVRVRAWGCSRPLVWCYGQPGMAEAELYNPEGASKNRRVDIYLRHGIFEVPRRRKRSEIPQPPGEPPMVDELDETGAPKPDLDDADGMTNPTGSGDQLVTVRTADGEVHQIQQSVLMAILRNTNLTFEEDDEEEEEEEAMVEAADEVEPVADEDEMNAEGGAAAAASPAALASAALMSLS